MSMKITKFVARHAQAARFIEQDDDEEAMIEDMDTDGNETEVSVH